MKYILSQYFRREIEERAVKRRIVNTEKIKNTLKTLLTMIKLYYTVIIISVHGFSVYTIEFVRFFSLLFFNTIYFAVTRIQCLQTKQHRLYMDGIGMLEN